VVLSRLAPPIFAPPAELPFHQKSTRKLVEPSVRSGVRRPLATAYGRREGAQAGNKLPSSAPTASGGNWWSQAHAAVSGDR
jgi:hypothetical protein